jgi:hypothetical protein
MCPYKIRSMENSFSKMSASKATIAYVDFVLSTMVRQTGIILPTYEQLYVQIIQKNLKDLLENGEKHQDECFLIIDETFREWYNKIEQSKIGCTCNKENEEPTSQKRT